MIIDLILDRKNGIPYIAREFYNNVMQYGKIGHDIASALDSGENGDVQFELAKYIKENGYDLSLIEYVNSFGWTQ